MHTDRKFYLPNSEHMDMCNEFVTRDKNMICIHLYLINILLLLD